MFGMDPPWQQGDDFTRLTQDPGSEEIEQAALCQMVPLIERDIHNHGLTLAKGGGPVEVASSHRLLIRPDDGRDERDRAVQTGWCMSGITDGYCDSVCGNCSYALPDSVEYGARSATSRHSKVHQTRVEQDQTVHYVGGGGWDRSETCDVWEDSIVPLDAGWYEHHDPMTHCTRNGIAGAHERGINPEGPRDEVLLTMDIALAGRFGHTSNTDAAAEFAQFETCRAKPDIAPEDSCRICGTRLEEGQFQAPCVHGENTATIQWPVSHARHNAPREAGEAGPEPRCRFGGFEVSGM
jgi:hypothetical protein